MNCRYCGNELNQAGGHCPHCGFDSSARDLKNILREIVRLESKERLLDGPWLLNLLADVAPQLKKERILLSALVNAGGNETIMESGALGERALQNAVKKTASQISEDYSVDPVKAEEICEVFAAVVFPEQNPLKEAPSPHFSGVACPHCGTVNKIESLFCSQCGRFMGSQDMDALYQKAIELLNKSISEQDVEDALSLLKTAADNGHPDAQYRLAEYYFSEDGVGPDPARALSLYRAAAENGNLNAMRILAKIYLGGSLGAKMGISKDSREGVFWLKRLCETSEDGADHMRYFIELDQDNSLFYDPECAFAELKRAEELGEETVYPFLANYYARGKGTRQDIPLARKYLMLAYGSSTADQNYTRAVEKWIHEHFPDLTQPPQPPQPTPKPSKRLFIVAGVILSCVVLGILVPKLLDPDSRIGSKPSPPVNSEIPETPEAANETFLPVPSIVESLPPSNSVPISDPKPVSDTGAPVNNTFSDLQVGDTLRFGHYEQSGNVKDGEESIEWIVLDKQSNRTLVISRYILERIAYDSQGGYYSPSWDDSAVCLWLNSAFYQEAFSAEEKSRIETVTVTNEIRNSQNKMFILNRLEAERYFPTEYSRKAEPTSSIASNNNWTASGRAWQIDEYEELSEAGRSAWLLRAEGYFADYAEYVDKDGEIQFAAGNGLGDYINGVRPALWIRTS